MTFNASPAPVARRGVHDDGKYPKVAPRWGGTKLGKPHSSTFPVDGVWIAVDPRRGPCVRHAVGVGLTSAGCEPIGLRLGETMRREDSSEEVWSRLPRVTRRLTCPALGEYRGHFSTALGPPCGWLAGPCVMLWRAGLERFPARGKMEANLAGAPPE